MCIRIKPKRKQACRLKFTIFNLQFLNIFQFYIDSGVKRDTFCSLKTGCLMNKSFGFDNHDKFNNV